MKKNTYLTFIAMTFASCQAFAAKSCEELKGEVATKVESKGVMKYALEIMDADQVGEKHVVGSCDGGTKKLVYTRE